MSDRRAFTLIEMLVVIFIIGLLAAVIIPFVLGPREEMKQVQTRSLFQTLVEPMDQYAAEHRGLYPPRDTDGRDLTVTLVRELDRSTYVTDFAHHPDSGDPCLGDGWGNPIVYRPWRGMANKDGAHNRESYDLTSPGADGIVGTEDDITNWR